MIQGLDSSYYHYGLGLAGDTSNKVIAVSTAGITPAIPAIAGAVFPSMAATAAIPIVGGIIAGVTVAIGLFLNRKGPQQKVASTKIVAQIEPYLQQNLDAWEKSSKTFSEQQQALANFNALWGRTVELLSNPQLGEPGQRGINDRNRGGKWDWWSYYYDPIANDPNVISDSQRISEGIQSQLNVGGGLGWLVVGGLAVLIGWGMLESKRKGLDN